jgi:hypothetical protein
LSARIRRCTEPHGRGRHHLRLIHPHLVITLLCGSKSARAHTSTTCDCTWTCAHALSHVLKEHHLLLLLRRDIVQIHIRREETTA